MKHDQQKSQPDWQEPWAPARTYQKSDMLEDENKKLQDQQRIEDKLLLNKHECSMIFRTFRYKIIIAKTA